ncbi:hypothetical protein BJV82DRAFT_492937, partial [Fennellomyces sp. T-0311]
YQSFFKSLNATTLHPSRQTNVDITPVLNHFRTLGPNKDLAIADLTKKLCWLLGVCGFLRPSDIHRIDLNQCKVSPEQDEVELHVVAPKQLRKGKKQVCTVTIKRHDDPLCCPVAAFRSYCRRFAQEPCIRQHPTLSSITLNHLVRKVQDNKQPIGSQRISKLIRAVMELIPQQPGRRTPKARAVGATRAAQAGASVDDIVTHGNWSSNDIYEKFYRIARETRTDFTHLAL